MTMTPPDPNAAEPSSALALVNIDQFKMALEPTTFAETINACKLVADAQLTGCETPAIVLAKVMAGRALGLGFMQSVMGIHNIKGTLSVSAKTKVALCLQSELCEYFTCLETTETKATYETKRRGKEPKRLTYTIEEAGRSKLLDRGEKADMNNWNRFPSAMLRARASSTLADLEYGDLLQGMPSLEEMRDVTDPREMVGEIVQQPVAAAPKRDWVAESKALEAEIATITETTSRKDRQVIRAKVAAFCGEAPEAFRMLIGRAYNECPPIAVKAGAPEAPNGTSTTQPVPAAK